MSSEAVNVAEGEPLIASIQLQDFKDDKFCRANVTQDGSPFPGTPFSVPSVGNGKYRFIDPVNFKFPIGFLEVEITIEVYNEAGFVTRSLKNGPVEKVYRLNNAVSVPDPEVINKLNEITNLISQQFFLEGDIVDEELIGDLLPDELDGHLDVAPELEGVLIPDTIDGHLEGDDELIGVLQEN